MKINRYATVDPSSGLPCISRVIEHNGIIYVSGVIAEHGGDIRAQTEQVLERIDHYLGLAGTDKSKLLTAQIWIADMSMFADMNSVWNAWVDVMNAPARACVRADLWENRLIEIMVTAAKDHVRS